MIAVFVLHPLQGGCADDPAVRRLQNSLAALSRIMSSPSSAIPQALLQRASAVAIVPGVFKVSFLIGTRFGKGVLVARGDDGRWGNPVFVTLGGGSFGIQAGLQSTDLVLVYLKGKPSVGVPRGRSLVGADAALIVGTRGVQMDENKSTDMETEVYSFSQTSGLTVGFSLNGMQLRLDDQATSSLYGRAGIKAADVISGRVNAASPETLWFRAAFLKTIGPST